VVPKLNLGGLPAQQHTDLSPYKYFFAILPINYVSVFDSFYLNETVAQPTHEMSRKNANKKFLNRKFAPNAIEGENVCHKLSNEA
jgi:hypothetical protein